MRKLIMIFILFGITLLFLSEGVNAECTDSDATDDFPTGFNPYTKGEATPNSTDDGIDFCTGGGSSVVEYYCKNNELKKEVPTCLYGCSNGACEWPETITDCSETDDGFDLYEKGATYGDGMTLEDDCHDSYGEKLIYEQSCIDPYLTSEYVKSRINSMTVHRDWKFFSVLYKCENSCINDVCICESDSECPSGYECSDGACIEPAWPVETAYFKCTRDNQCFFSNYNDANDGRARFVLTKVFHGYNLPTDKMEDLDATLTVDGSSEKGYTIRIILEEDPNNIVAFASKDVESTATSTFIGLLIVAFIGGYWYYSKRKSKRKRIK